MQVGDVVLILNIGDCGDVEDRAEWVGKIGRIIEERDQPRYGSRTFRVELIPRKRNLDHVFYYTFTKRELQTANSAQHWFREES